MRRRVVVTGMGVISPIGNGVGEFWGAMLRGVSGAGPITRFDASGFATRIAAEVKGFEPERYLDRKELRRMDRAVQFSTVAAFMALEDAHLQVPEAEAHRYGICIGSGIGGIATLEREMRVLLERGPERVSPFFVPMMIINMAPGHLSILTGIRGPNKAVVTACATSAHTIGDAMRWIQYGEADVVLAGGTEAPITPLAVAGFCSMRAMTRRNHDPQRASRPFDADRDGFLMGEGAGVLVLEELERAKRRGARIYAELVGYGMSGDAYHLSAPDPCGTGAAEAMLAALRDAGLSPEEVDYINAHAPSTPLGDASEVVSIKRAFGEHARRLVVSSTKSMTGHLLGAAGAVEMIATVLALFHGVVPPTINYETPDPQCDLDVCPNEPREQPLRVALCNSFGFGGQNACLVARRFEG